MSEPHIVATRNLALAAFWVARGLRFVETDACEDPNDCRFVFEDAPAGTARRLREEFYQSRAIQTFVHARLALSRSLAIAKHDPTRRCRTLPASSRSGVT